MVLGEARHVVMQQYSVLNLINYHSSTNFGASGRHSDLLSPLSSLKHENRPLVCPCLTS